LGPPHKVRALQCWEKALRYYESKDEELQHNVRTKANIALELLRDNDEENQKKGFQLLEETTAIKSRIGDLDGLANNYSNIGFYYWKIGKYEQAIAYFRKDLYLSRKVGNLRSVATTLGNLSVLYTDLKQLSSARDLLREAKQIGEKLQDKKLLEITDNQLKLVDTKGKEAGLKGEKIGLLAPCACNSGKPYQECCGRADFEPYDLSMIYGGISEDLEPIIQQAKLSGIEPSRLDFLLRKTSGTNLRFAWSRLTTHNGWLEMKELPDMTNI
jgi:tetratricopeptide (TPR) repeat protein